MFKLPDPLSEHVSQGLLGMPVELIPGEESAQWQRIRTPDDYVGWVARAGLSVAPSGWHGPWAEVTDLWVNLRGRNDYRLAAASQAVIGSRLPIVEKQPGWVRLLLPDDRRLWVESHRVEEVGEEALRPPVAESVCTTAEKMLGSPYLWGGCSPLGIDCSGFVQLVMRLHGVSLLRDAHLQAEQGRPIDPPGAADLVFFGPEERLDRITHVGLTLDSERFIHAAGSDRVRINRLDDEPYRQQLRFARRVLP
jgi:hypothetical protein